MKIRPLYDRVVVQRLEEKRTSQGGIVIPDSATEKPTFGKVLEVGPGKADKHGKIHQPLSVKKGDKILFGKYAGTEMKVHGEDLIVMREDDIMGIIE